MQLVTTERCHCSEMPNRSWNCKKLWDAQFVSCRNEAGGDAVRANGADASALGAVASRHALFFLEIREEFLESVFLELGYGDELKGCGVDAVAQPGGFGAVFKDMAKMGVSRYAADFRACHSIRGIDDVFDRFCIDRLGEGRPAGARIEFVFGAKKRLTADDGDIDSRLFVVPIFIIEGGLGAILHCDFVLDGC